MNNEVLELEYEIEFEQIRRVWVDYFKKSLPNILAFWGTGLLCSLALWLFLENQFFGPFLTLFAGLVPLLVIYFNYSNYMRAARESFKAYTGEDKFVRLVFRQGEEGFEARHGKNFSFTAWKSIGGVEEFDDNFVFTRAGHPFYIPKSAFRSASDVGLLRFLISSNVEKNVKLLD